MLENAQLPGFNINHPVPLHPRACQFPNQRYFQKQLYLHAAAHRGLRQDHSPPQEHTAGPFLRESMHMWFKQKRQLCSVLQLPPHIEVFRFAYLSWQRQCRGLAHTHHVGTDSPYNPRQPKHTSNKMRQCMISLSIHSFIFCFLFRKIV